MPGISPQAMIYLSTACLKTLREKPNWTFPPPCFPALCNYYWGCQDTMRCINTQNVGYLELAGFDQWLCERFQIGLLSFRWPQIIWERASEDRERVVMFADLFLEYRAEREKQGLQPSQSINT